MLTTVTTKGQVTIPGDVRRILNIEVGDKIYFEKVEQTEKLVQMRVIKRGGISERLYGALKTKIKMEDIEQAREAVAAEIADYHKLK